MSGSIHGSLHEETLPQSDHDRKIAMERGSRTNIPRPFDRDLEIPGYELIRPLGRGAFGEVWLALAANTRREVAIKVFTRSTGLDWDLLRREVEKMAAVATERRVVQLLEVGWQGEHPYFVMEYLPGGSLAETLAGEGPDTEKAVGYFREIAKALVYLHGKAILHCDLKPANVLLDGHGGLRLADFGQARARYERSATGGTLFYMAPEQAEPGAQPDVRSDLYSLGAILFALLTGHPPHASESNSREIAGSSTVTDQLEKYQRLLRTSPPPTDHPVIQKLDRPLQEILKRCLNPDPGERFANAQQVLNAVDARQRVHQQRPLMVFGFVAPLFLLVGLAAVGFGVFDATVKTSRQTLIQQALNANSATARVAAAALDYNLSAVERRVSREALDPDLRRLLADPAAAGSGVQQFSDTLYETYKTRHLYSWVVADRHAEALARSPFDPRVVGSSYGYREWFSGKVEALQGDLPADTSARRETGLTLAFRSTAEDRPVLVSVAAPILPPDSDPADDPDPIGVLAATVHLGTFQEWLVEAEAPAAGDCPERLVLLLNRGQLVRHPCPAPGTVHLPVGRSGFFDTASVQRLLASSDSAIDGFLDPLRPDSQFLATAAPLDRHPSWTAVVLQEQPKALAPLRDLARRIRQLAWAGLGGGLIMVLSLYALLNRVTSGPRP